MTKPVRLRTMYHMAQLTRAEIVLLTGTDVERFKKYYARGQLPFTPLIKGYSLFDALLTLISEQFSTGDNSFGSEDFPTAAKIVANCKGDIFDEVSRLKNADSIDFFIGYAFLTSEAGQACAGSLNDVSNALEGRHDVRKIALVNVSLCARILKARAAKLGIDVTSL